jgi:hypothetical protein
MDKAEYLCVFAQLMQNHSTAAVCASKPMMSWRVWQSGMLPGYGCWALAAPLTGSKAGGTPARLVSCVRRVQRASAPQSLLASIALG